MPWYRHRSTKAVKQADSKPGPDWDRVAQGGDPVEDTSNDAEAAVRAEQAEKSAKPATKKS